MEYSYTAQLALLIYYCIVLQCTCLWYAVLCQNSPDDQLLPEGVNEGLYYDEGYAFYELPAEEEEDSGAEILCYTCHYSKTTQHVQGMSNCDEPFSEKDIPIVQCQGSCAITKTSLGAEEEYLIIRGCLDTCLNMSVPDSSVECCNSSKCNGRKSNTLFLAASLGTFSFIFTMGLMFSVCYRIV